MNILAYILIACFVYISSFLLHELCHIKSQGIQSKGWIYVNGWGMTCSVASGYKYGYLFFYAGGVYCSIIMSLLACASSGWWQWCWLTMAWLQLFYGLYEGLTNGNVTYRYWVYITVISIMVIIWIIKEVYI